MASAPYWALCRGNHTVGYHLGQSGTGFSKGPFIQVAFLCPIGAPPSVGGCASYDLLHCATMVAKKRSRRFVGLRCSSASELTDKSMHRGRECLRRILVRDIQVLTSGGRRGAAGGAPGASVRCAGAVGGQPSGDTSLPRPYAVGDHHKLSKL